VIIVLGDHGEEFMERSRWGHSAEFNRFQTGTPAVIRVPGNAAARGGRASPATSTSRPP
jgi:membrane-anchored protein YejM (alkaline phosphatase superfamily)